MLPILDTQYRLQNSVFVGVTNKYVRILSLKNGTSVSVIITVNRVEWDYPCVILLSAGTVANDNTINYATNYLIRKSNININLCYIKENDRFYVYCAPGTEWANISTQLLISSGDVIREYYISDSKPSGAVDMTI